MLRSGTSVKTAENERAWHVRRTAAETLYRQSPCGRAEVLLMDEPTSALDPISTSKIEDLAMELKKDYTIVMSHITCSRRSVYLIIQPSSCSEKL